MPAVVKKVEVRCGSESASGPACLCSAWACAGPASLWRERRCLHAVSVFGCGGCQAVLSRPACDARLRCSPQQPMVSSVGVWVCGMLTQLTSNCMLKQHHGNTLCKSSHNLS